MFLQAVTSVMPLLIIICLGYASAKLPWFGRTGMDFLSKFNIDIIIPIYMFYNVIRTYPNRDSLLDLWVNVRYPFIVIFCTITVGAIMAKILRFQPPQRGVFINAVSLSNVVVMGLPVTESLFKDTGLAILPIGMIYYAANTMIYWTVGIWLLRRDVGGTKGMGVVKTVKTVFMSRPLLGFIFGILWVMLDIQLPEFVLTPMAMISRCVTTLAMLFIGCVIRFTDFQVIRESRELKLIVLYRLLFVPLASGLICSLMPIDPTYRKVFFILSNMPAMAQLPIMAKEVNSDYKLASMATAMTTAVSMAAVPFYITIMESLKFLD